MKMKTFVLHGHTYTVAIDANGQITQIACKGRWPLTDARFIGDEWIVTQLQAIVDSEKE